MPKRTSAAARQQQQRHQDVSGTKSFYNKMILLVLVVIATLETYRTFVQVETNAIVYVQVTEGAAEGLVAEPPPLAQSTAATAVEDSVPRAVVERDVLPISTKVEVSTSNNVVDEKKLPDSIVKQIQKNNPNRDIVFIHVGKAGGVAIRENVAAQCFQWFPDIDTARRTKAENHKERETCFANFKKEEYLARQTKHFAHIFIQQMDPQVLQNATTFLINVRNPIDRIVSSYRYTHPGNCKREGLPKGVRPSFGCYLLDHGRIKKGSKGYQIYEECFADPAMEDFAQALLPPYNDNNNSHFATMTPPQIETCRKIARSMVLGEPHGKLDQHMEANYQFYAKETFWKYPDKEIFAIRTESEYQDMQGLDRAMGGTGTFRKPENKYSHGSEFYKPSPLSQQATHKLCCVLEKEIQVYLEIFEKAVNMSPQDQKEAENVLRKQCGLQSGDSWMDWRRNCQSKMHGQQSTG